MICDQKCHLCTRDECLREQRQKENYRRYYEKNKEKRIAYQKEYNKSHREQYLKHLKKYFETHKEQRKEYDHQRWLKRKERNA